MKRFFLGLFCVFISAFAFAQTAVNQGKNFVVYSYTDWQSASKDFVKMCEDYALTFIYIDECESQTDFFTFEKNKWQFFIVRVISNGEMCGTLYVSSPSGRQSKLVGGKSIPKLSFSDLITRCLKNAEIGINNMESLYSFLGEDMPGAEDKVGDKNKEYTESFVVTSGFSSNREIYDWYTGLDLINVKTNETPSALVHVQVSLGYKKDDKAACMEIANRRIEIVDMLRRFFSEQTANDFKPQNEEILRQKIKDLLNDTILIDSRIRDVRFTQLDVTRSY